MKLEQKSFPFFQTSGISKTASIPYKVIGSCQFNVSCNILIRNEISDIVLVAITPICIYGGDIESTNHFLFQSPDFSETKQTLFDNNQNKKKS